MEVLKCKMCAGNLEVQKGELITTCPYCGTQQTLPNLESEKFVDIYNKMNTFRQNQDYEILYVFHFLSAIISWCIVFCTKKSAKAFTMQISLPYLNKNQAFLIVKSDVL